MSQGRIGKSSASPGGTEIIPRNICSYQVPTMSGTNVSTNKNRNFYNSTVQTISRGGGYCATKVGSICARFVDMVALVKNQA